MDDLHTEDDDEGGECPTRVGKRLGRSKSYSTGRQRVVARYDALTKFATMNGYKEADVKRVLFWMALLVNDIHDNQPWVRQHRGRSK